MGVRLPPPAGSAAVELRARCRLRQPRRGHPPAAVHGAEPLLGLRQERRAVRRRRSDRTCRERASARARPLRRQRRLRSVRDPALRSISRSPAAVLRRLSLNSIARCFASVVRKLSPGGRFYVSLDRTSTEADAFSAMHWPDGSTTWPDREPFHYTFEMLAGIAELTGGRAERLARRLASARRTADGHHAPTVTRYSQPNRTARCRLHGDAKKPWRSSRAWPVVEHDLRQDIAPHADSRRRHPEQPHLACARVVSQGPDPRRPERREPDGDAVQRSAGADHTDRCLARCAKLPAASTSPDTSMRKAGWAKPHGRASGRSRPPGSRSR